MKPIRHINQLGSRVREQGRLRMGVKTGNAMKALKHWRFTSPEKEPLDQLAVLYGGEVRPWSDPKAGQGTDQFELLSTAEKVRVMIPPGGLTTWYEQWAGGGVQRRCDGETVFIDGDEEKAQPCLCSSQGVMLCKPKTRLSVVLPEVSPFGGVWRLDTGSWNAADEMTAMERLLNSLQIDGLVEAQLLIDERTPIIKGKKRKFVVPVILISASAQQALGHADSGAKALMAGEPVPLALPEPPAATQADSEDVVDAQVMDLPDYDRAGMDARLVIALDIIVQREDLITLDVLMTALALGGSNGSTTDLDALADSQHAKVVRISEAIAQGKKHIVRIENSRLVLK